MNGEEIMIQIQPLTALTSADLRRVASSFTSSEKYEVRYTHSDSHVTFELQRILLDEPKVRQYNHYDEETLQRYNDVLAEGYSFGAYTGEQLIGLILASAHHWNHSIWVWEFHVVETHRRLGAGRGLMNTLAEKARREGFRTIVCETQNTNATAIQVYLKLGFSLEGVDISYYTNEDYPEGDIAVFMKKRLK
jgi:ribosomal protein S18 acetylase RimI-like enzyme